MGTTMAWERYRIRERKYPLPKPEEWLETASLTNDNPWDWLRLDALYAYPPKIVERPVRKPKDKPRPDTPQMEKCVEIVCFSKLPPRFVPLPCKCGRDPENPQLPDGKPHDKSKIRIRHNRMFNLPTWLVLERARYKCQRCGQTYSEELDGIYTDIHITREFRDNVLLTAIKRPFSDAAALMSVDVNFARRLFMVHAAGRLKNYRFKMPTVMGVDEVHIFDQKRANFVVTDLYSKRILDFGEGRTIEDLKAVFEPHVDEVSRERVKAFIQDMNADYKDFARINFPKAKIVIDKFHVLATINKAMNKARIAFGKEPGMTDEDRQRLSRHRFLFLETPEKMTDAEIAQRNEILEGSEVLSAAYEIKRRFYRVYQEKTRKEAEDRFERWADKVVRENAIHFMPAVQTVRDWHNEIFNYFEFRNRYNNGFVEALNGRLRRMHEAGPNIDYPTFRAKALLRYGRFYGKDDFEAHSLRGVPQNRWRRYADREGPNLSDGLDADAFFSDLERGIF